MADNSTGADRASEPEEQGSRRINELAAQLRSAEQRVTAILDATVEAIVTADTQGVILSFNRAAETIFGYSAEEAIGRNVSMLMPSPFAEEHNAYLQHYHDTGEKKIIGIGREVRGQRKNGQIFPLDLAISEVLLGDERLFTAILRDISDRRRLEQEILRISEMEQRRIGQDLHDGLGQMLTGIGLMSKGLAKRLESIDADAADAAIEITDLIRSADEQARALARGLIPVDIEARGLSTALRRLAENAETMFGIKCTFSEAGTAPVWDSSKATHLFRIAQEAVSNAVKHGKSNRVSISFASGEDQVRLRVSDNGLGFKQTLPTESGMGVNIMHYRTQIINGSLDIRSTPNEGVTVTCTVPLPR